VHFYFSNTVFFLSFVSPFAISSSTQAYGLKGSNTPFLGAESPQAQFFSKNTPLLNALSKAHDKMLDVLGASSGSAMKKFLNIPTMPIAAVATAGSYMSHISVTYQFQNRAK